MSIDFSVKGKHVLITGGTGGIGAAFAEAFSQAGAVVTLVDIAPPRADQKSGLKYEQVDMGDDAEVETRMIPQSFLTNPRTSAAALACEGLPCITWVVPGHRAGDSGRATTPSAVSP